MDIDVEKFFDRVNHDMLMARVARVVQDKRVLRLIRRYLQSGVMVNGVVMETGEGIPQGGPLSPLLANIMLHDLDLELEERGHRFVRYADDCNIYVRTPRAGERVMASVVEFLQKRLKLKVNEQKSAVDRPERRKFLGFTYYKFKGQVRIRLSNQTRQRLRAKVRSLTRRRRSENLQGRIQRLNAYLAGWIGYFALADTPGVFADLDGWIRRRLRACLWKQWKAGAHPPPRAATLAASRVGGQGTGLHAQRPWRLAKVLSNGLGKEYWSDLGLVSLGERYARLRHA